MLGEECVATRLSTGVVRRPGGNRGEDTLEGLEEFLTLVPTLVGDDDPWRETVETRVVGDHRRHVTSLKVDLLLGPCARHDDHGRDVAQFATHRLGDQRLVVRLATFAFGADAKNDRVVCLVRTGHVDIAHARVIRQVRAHPGAPCHDAQESTFD